MDSGASLYLVSSLQKLLKLETNHLLHVLATVLDDDTLRILCIHTLTS